MKLPAPVLVLALNLAALGACNPEHGRGFSEATSTVHLAPSSTLVVGLELGEVMSKEIAISGRDRRAIPDTTDEWWCGRPLKSTSMANVAWLQLINPSEDTLGLSVGLDGLAKTQPRIYVYAEKDPPLQDCVTVGMHRRLGDATSIVIEPSSSAFLLISAGGATGVYTLSVKTDHVISP